jgi:menaquinone-dependent protoporphyrinogen oxidase
MKGMVAYHSKWGNCAQVAEAVATGLREAGQDVELVDVKSMKEPGGPPDFLVAGSGTRAGNMTGPMRKFLKHVAGEEWRGKPFAAFGTGLLKGRDKDEPQSAKRINDLLQEKGLKPIVPAFQAAVTGMKGPLAEGDLEGARAFGTSVGEALGRGDV